MEIDKKYVVEINGPGLNVLKEIPASAVEILLGWLLKVADEAALNGQQPEVQIERIFGLPTDSPAGIPQLSLQQFIAQYSPRRIPDKLACFGLYIREYRSKNEFNKEELIELFQEASQPIPKNIIRDLRWTQEIEWIMPVPFKSGSYYLTKKGEAAVYAKFAKVIVGKTRYAGFPARPKKVSAEN